MKSVLAFIVIFFLVTINIFSATITSVATGDWNNAATWDAGVPAAGDDVVIAAGHTVTLNQDATVLSLTVNGNLVIGNDATARNLTITGTTSVNAGGSFTVGAFNITHNVSFQGAVTNDGSLDFYNNSSQVADAVFSGTYTVGGSNSPQFAKVTFNSGTVTAGVAFDINGAVVIENGATFAADNFTHTVAGNWTENGTGQMTGNGTIQMDATLIQSVTTAATFYNLVYNGGGIGVLGANVTVTNDFSISNNTEVQSSQYHTFQGNFTVADGSTYEATAGRVTFNSATETQTITIGTTGGTSNVEFYEVYFNNGGAGNPKVITGDMIAKGLTYIYDDAVLNDGGNNHTLNGFRIDGTCNLSGTITSTGGTFYDDGGDGDFTVGTANIIAQYLYVGSNDIMRVNGNVTVGLEDNGDYNYLVINNGSQLIGQAGKTLLVKGSKWLYIRGENNFPTGFGTITFDPNSFARYDSDIPQTINSSVPYWHLYLNYNTKTASNNLDINGNLYLYSNVDFQMGAYSHTIAGSIVNTDDVGGNGSLTSTGTVTLDAPDGNQNIYNGGSGTYTFNNLTITNTAPTTVHYKYINDNIIVNGNFSATNTGGDNANRLYVYMYENTITGGNNFNLGAYVWLLTSGTNTFETSMSSFSGTKTFDVNSTVRFDRTVNGSNQNIPGGFTYGNIEIYGDNQKLPQANLDVNGDFSAVGYTPVLTDNSHQINVAGDWNMHQNYTNLTGTNVVVFDGSNQDISNSKFSYVYFSNSGTKTISGTLDILNNLVIQTNVIVDAVENYIYIEGNWTENGTAQFIQTGGMVTFDGTTANQIIKTNANSYFYNLTINKPTAGIKTLTLNSNIDINGTFDFAEDNAALDMNGYDIHVARDFYFREGCTLTHNNGKAYFDGNDAAQLIRNYNTNTIVFYDAEFSGTAVKRLYENSFRFQGDVTINNTTLDGQWWDHYVEGDWINTGIFRHSRTLYFDGAGAQNISQSSFNTVRFGGGAFTKTLSGDITLTGHLYIDDATLDVSASNYNITLDDYWHNDSTGSFIAREGTVTVTGEYNRIFTGKTNTLYGTGQVITEGGTKDFYNLTINATNSDYWMFIHGNLTVKNNFEIVKGRFYQSYDAGTYGINDIEVGGNFINHGSLYYNNYGEKITLNPTSGSHIFDPGSSNTYSITNFEGAAGTAYTFESNLNTYANRAITITNGNIDLNSNKITTNSAGGDINLNGGTLEVDSAAVISMGSGATFTNAGGIFKLTGHTDDPASLIAASGNYTFVQTSGTIHAQNYRIENTSGNGIDIQGGSIDATNTFQNGSFSSGTGTAYLTTSGIDLGVDRTITGVTFNSGPTYNVQRTSGTGNMNFENATGTLAGENYDNDPGTFVNWSYPGAAYWDGNTDGDGDNVHWNDPSNWANDAVPDANSIVILDHTAVAGAYTVDLNTVANGLAKSITINSGTDQISLVLNGFTLTVSEDISIGSNSVLTQTNAGDIITLGGSWSNAGTFNEGTSTVIFNPTTGTHTINTLGAADPFYNFTINGTGGTNVISSTLDIDGSVNLMGGTLNGGTNTITVAGDWTRSGGAVFNYETSTVDFNNAGAQNINGGEFYNFITSGSGTKTATANIDINRDITIGAGTVFDGGTNIIYVGDDWTNNVGNAGFTQTGAGTVIFDGTADYQDISNASVTTFNHLTISGTQTKYTRNNITINGNLVINGASLYIVDGTTVDGAGGSNTINMSAGRIFVNGANNFPSNFETINLSGGTVDYYANINQTIYPTTYYQLMVRRINSGNATTKTLSGDITVNESLYIYDNETTLDVNNHTINLWGGLSLETGGPQIVWGANGTLNHFGEYFTVDADITGFNNVIKRNRGYFRVYHQSLNITGDMSILEDAYLYQDTVNITSTGTGKTFTLAATAFVYDYNTTSVGKAFPVNFANYNLHKDSRVYLTGTVGDQTIYTVPNYGNLYLYTSAEINQTLDGNLDVEGSFGMYNEPTLVDAGFNINIAGANVDIRKYTPSGSTTMTFDGADQRIYDAGLGATVFDMKNVVFAGTGTKSIYYGGEDYINVTGNLTVNAGVTLYCPYRLDFSGENWTNNGIFNNTGYVINFTGTSAQTIDPGVENDFYAVNFANAGTKTFVNNGIDVNNGTFTIGSGTTVNMNALTHNIASERITNNGTWTTSNANFIWDRNGTQYIPAMTAKDFTFRKYDQWTRYRYLEGAINIDDLTIEEGIQFMCSANGETTTPTYNVTMTGNFNNEGYLYAWGNTFAFESNTTDAKTIKQGDGFFDNVTFNQSMLTQETRTYTLTEETRFYEDLTIGTGATLDLNGQILRLGNDDPNDPVEPRAEEHEIQTGGTLDVDAGANLYFSCRDDQNPVLNVNGTLKIVGTNGNNATVSSTDWYTNAHRIDINVNNGATVHAQYYLMKYLTDDGFYVDAGATIDATNDFSNGTWSDLSGVAGSRYLYCNAKASGLGTVDNLTFNYSGTPVAGTHFNVKRDASCGTVLTFGGTASGLLAGSTYEADEVGENNTGTSKIEWPPVSEVYWTGTVSTDWFTAGNWSPATVPTNLIDAIIPIRANNPIITGSNATCKHLKITDGFLTLQTGWDLTVNGDVYVGTGTSVGILAIEDASCDVNVSGNWTRGQNALFVHGGGTVLFNAPGGSVSIDARDSEFGNLTFNGGATFMLNRQETFVDGNFTIINGTVSPIVNDYRLKIRGNYNNVGGTFDNSTYGTVYFDGSAAQTITNGIFWHVEIDGAGIKSNTNALRIDGNLNIKNATLQGGAAIDMNGYVTIQATGTFDDGGFTHTFSGYRWTGTGTYIGSGIIEFDRDGYQYITESDFNSLLLKNNGGVILEGNIDMTGNLSLIEPCIYLNVQTYQVTNTSGTGTLSLAATRYIYVRGANNFPVNFATYSLHETSYTIYDGTMPQTIAPVPVVYGHVYIDNSAKTAGGHLDINGILYFYDDASLDVTANNYRINIEGHWYNLYGATFTPREGEVIFDGNDAYSYLYIYEESKNTNPFYKLTVNKGAGGVYSYWTDITVQNNLRALNGMLYQNQIMYVGGDMSALSGKFGTAGTYYLNKTTGSSNLQLNGSVLYNLTVNSSGGATYYLQDNLNMNGQFDLIAGTFNANGKLVRMGDYGEVNEISGLYIMGAGGILQLPDYGTFKVNSGGEVQVVGDVDNVATVTNYNGRYYFNVENGGTIKARNYMFEYMAEAGIYIKDGGIIHNDYNFSYGTFTNSAAGGTCLRIENNQNFTEAGGNPIVEVSFPYNPGGGASNVTKTIAVGGTLDFKDYSGQLAGEDFDNDPTNLINWVSPPYVMWTGNIDNDWYKIGNWEVTSGPDRIPLISDNVIITQRTNQPIINIDGAVAKSLDVQQNAILTLHTAAATDTTLIVAEDVNFRGTIVMTSGADTLCVGGNWNNTGMFMAGEGTVILNSLFGIKSINNYNDFFYNLHINSVSDIQLSRNTTVNNNFIIKNGNFDLTASNRVLTVKGNFYNFDNFISSNGKLILAGTGANQIFNPGSSTYYNIDISASNNVTLTDNNLSINHNMNISSGTFNLNSLTFNLGDGGTDALTLAGGNLIVNANAYLKPANNATVEVTGGTLTLLGTDIDNPAYLQSQSGTYTFNVNSGGTIQARYYNIQNTNANGIRIKEGATIDGTNNFRDGVWRNGTSPGQYLWLENDFADYTVTGVYFHNGASVNVKRDDASTNGVITFEDAIGLLAGYQYENDDNSATTGAIHWTYTHPQNNWIGGVSTDWNDPNNWGMNRVPNNLDAAIIPDINEADHWNPTIGINAGSANGVCYDLRIENGGILTFNNDKDLDVDNTVTVIAGGSMTVTAGSLTQINVADIWSVDGTFNHGSSSTVVFDAPAGKLLTIAGNTSFWNFEINSTGNAEYMTGSSLNIDGNCTITAGEFTISDAAHTLYVGGNFSNSGTFNHGNGKIVLDGTNQTVSNTGTGNFYKLSCEGSQTKTLSSDITVENDIEIKLGSTLNGSNHNLTLFGDWVNRGTFVPATGTVSFTGTNTQLVDNYNSETFYNFVVNNTSVTFPQVLLYGDLTLTGTNWTMTDGVIETTTDEMLTIEQNIILTGGNTSASYVTGPLTRTGSSDFTFPIGDGLKFARLGISGMSASGTFVAQYFEAAYTDLSVTGTLDHVSGYEHWTLNRTSGTAEPKLTFYWEDGAESGIDNLASLTTALYVDPDWEDRGRASTTGTVSAGSITSLNVFTTFGACGFGSTDADNPLHGYSRWTGAQSTVWNNPNNWTMGVPTATIDALIPSAPANQPVIDIDAVTRKLTIDAGASLNVNPLKSLTTEGRFTINGTFILKSDASGNASLINLSTISYGASSEVITQLYLSGSKYHHVASPTVTTDADRFKSDPYIPYYNPNFYSYNESGSTWNQLGTDWNEFSGNMVPMTGYTYYVDRNLTVLIKKSNSGEFNTGDKSKTLTYTGNTEAEVIHRGWNFIGNPYPATIDWNAEGWTKQNIYNSIYFWNGNNYSYYVAGDGPQDGGLGTANATNLIAPMQGYFVKVKEGSDTAENQTGVLLTPESARTTQSVHFWKRSNIVTDILMLRATNSTYFDQTALWFKNNATQEIDDNLDAFKLFTDNWYGVPQIYSITPNNIPLAINSTPLPNDSTIIPLGFVAPYTDLYVFSIDSLNLVSFTDVYFVDKLNNVEIPLTDLPYSFNAEAGTYDNRFELRFKKGISTDIKQIEATKMPEISIFYSNGDICLQSLTADAIVGKIEIFNSIGQIIVSTQNTRQYQTRINLQSDNGVYVVRLSNKYGTTSKRLVIVR